MGNGQTRDIVSSLAELDDSHVINQGTNDMRQPQLGFHTVHGTNVILLRNGRVARRKESFCKGLAFSNRAVGVDEIICLRLTEVATNWSGVLRFGVTNIDPETYRSVPVPKFACPDLTAKEGYWAKALPERYSVEGNILHFYINASGELFYGINGSMKGIFLTGINVNLPMWLIVDIYGNSVALEFIDPSEFRPPRRETSLSRPTGPTQSRPPPTPTIAPPTASSSNDSDSTNAGRVLIQSVPSGLDPLRFHTVTGRHVSLNSLRNIATRDDREYSQGYVFTERPIRNNEKIVIMVTSVQHLYEGGLAFGVTCCDPTTLRTSELPDDSSDLIEMPQYWVGIKDIALQPRQNTVLNFWITDSGEVKFEKDAGGARTVLHVDNTLPLFAYFDVYGSTQAIRILGSSSVTRSHSPNTAVQASSQRVVLPPAANRRDVPAPVSQSSSSSSNNRTGADISVPIRVGMRPSRDSTSNDEASRLLPVIPPRRTIDDLLSDAPLENPPRLPERTPPPITPRTDFGEATLFARHQARQLICRVLERHQNAPAVSEHGLSRPRGPSTTISSVFPTAAISSPAAGIAHAASSTTANQLSTPFESMQSSSQPTLFRTMETADNDNGDGDGKDECLICMSATINSVLYTCGHMCMCFTCARQQAITSGTCPICRGAIKDVIKCFKS